MQEAVSKLEFEKAALLRDQIMELKKTTGGTEATAEKQSRVTDSSPARSSKSELVLQRLLHEADRVQPKCCERDQRR